MNTTMESNECLQVFVRCRPLQESEMQVSAPVEVHAEVNKIIVRDVGLNKNVVKAYSFDKVFSSEDGQAMVYNNVASPLIQEVLMGFNCTILAYGQTGTGKTFTIEGDRTAALNNITEDSKAGIIPRSMKHIFEELTRQKYDFEVNVSFLELYNEEIFDLLSKADDLTKLKLYDSSKGSVTVQGLEIQNVKSMQDVYDVLDKGCKKRRKAATFLNKMSSRSHTVFTVIVKMKEHSTTMEKTKTGKLNMVDLAGSENIGRSGAVEKRAREAGNINQSLLALGRVITALCENAIHIPYRESKLTRLLRDSLGGQTKTSVIATISPSIFHIDETLNTLDYAMRAKNIVNKPGVNAQVSATALTKDYLEKIQALEREINELSSKVEFQVHPDNLKYLETAIATKSRELREEFETKEKLMAESLELDEAILKATETLGLKKLEWKKYISEQDEVAERLKEEQKEIQSEERELHILEAVKVKLHQKLHKVMKENEDISNEVKKMEKITTEAMDENSRLQRQFHNMCRAERKFNESLLQFKNQLQSSINEIQKSIMQDKTECDKYLSLLDGGFDSFNESSEKLCQQFGNVISDVEKLNSNLRESLIDALRYEEMQAKKRQSDIECTVSLLKPCNFDAVKALLISCEEDLHNLLQSLTHWRDTLLQKVSKQEILLNTYLSAEDQNVNLLKESCKVVTQKQKEFIQEYSELIFAELSKESERKTKFDEKMNVLEGTVEQLENFFTETLDDDVENTIWAHDMFREHVESEMRNAESILVFCESSMNATKSFKEEISLISSQTLDNKMNDISESTNRAIANFKELLPNVTNCVQQTKAWDENIQALEQVLIDDKSRRTEMPTITLSIENFKDILLEKEQFCKALNIKHQNELSAIEANQVKALNETQDSFNHLHDTFTQGVSKNISSIETSHICGVSWKEDIFKDDFDTTLLSAEEKANQEGSSVLDVTFAIPQENTISEEETGCKFCKNKDDGSLIQSPMVLSSTISVAKPSKSTVSKSSKQGKNKKEISHSILVEKWCKELFGDHVANETSESDNSVHIV